MIYDPVNVRISVSNKRQVWYGGPEPPDPPPKSATINIDYKPYTTTWEISAIWLA